MSNKLPLEVEGMESLYIEYKVSSIFSIKTELWHYKTTCNGLCNQVEFYPIFNKSDNTWNCHSWTPRSGRTNMLEQSILACSEKCLKFLKSDKKY